jgi:phytoene synthase
MEIIHERRSSMNLAAASVGSGLSLAKSREYCAQLTKSEARNFYYGLKLLPEAKRAAMFALYAYMRLVDDIADDEDGRRPDERSESLDTWDQTTRAVIAGQTPADNHPLWPAFAEMVERHSVPPRVFQEVIAGQRQDLVGQSFETFAELREYCYRVAGVVGIASIYIWGFDGGEQTEALAIDRGVAFQLTNILRDLREDGARGRVYLPRQELKAAGISPDDLRAGNGVSGFVPFMRQQIARAQSFYESSAPLDARIDADSRPTLTAMTQIYHGLLEKMALDPQRVLHHRISLSTLAKVRIAWRAARAR